ncbi:MAG TPA: hypothetical protein VKU60_07000, partial [Chloroflexota bacterium]|nr:hypothetical protein [Chloroflexota bacterium]
MSYMPAHEFQVGDRVTICRNVEGLALAGRLARVTKGGFTLSGRRYHTVRLDQPVTSSGPAGGSGGMRLLPIPADALAPWEPLAATVRRTVERARSAATPNNDRPPAPAPPSSGAGPSLP